jgi:hypothetical protein
VTVESLQMERSARLTLDQIRERRRKMDADGWLFVKWVCGHGEHAVERFHRPLFYLYAGDALRLAACLNKYTSEIVSQIKTELLRRGIDWNTRQGVRALARLLRRANVRISRSMSKTTMSLDALTWLASRTPQDGDMLAGPSGPDISIALTSKSDPVAQDKFCESIGNIIKSDEYRLYYSDRIYPVNPESYITKKWIRLNGRTKPADQETFEARGVTSQWPAHHYRIICGDDIVGTEDGEASQDDALHWLSRIHGISIAEGLGGSRHTIIGTISGPKDDHAALRSNDEFLTVVVPIWKKDVPANLSNILVDGVPTLPEWYPLDAIKAMRADTLANGAMGAISWLQNFELTANELGAMQFSADLLNRAKFHWVNKPIGTKIDGSPDVRRYMRRYLFDADGKPVPDPRRKPDGHPCHCWMRCQLPVHAYVEFDPLALPRYLGVDQSLSLKGDKWSVAVFAVDPYGHRYALKGATGKGYRNLIPAIPIVFNRYGGEFNPPKKVGIESNAWQGVTADWMKRTQEFQVLARRLVPVSPGQTQKEVRIFNNVLANLEMGMLHLDPDDHDRDAEMLKYSAADDNPEDNILDSIAICETIAQAKPYKDESADLKAEIAAQEAAYLRDIDPVTNIDLSNDWFEVM